MTNANPNPFPSPKSNPNHMGNGVAVWQFSVVFCIFLLEKARPIYLCATWWGQFSQATKLCFLVIFCINIKKILHLRIISASSSLSPLLNKMLGESLFQAE